MMKRMLAVILVLSSVVTSHTAAAAPAPWGIAISDQGECGGFWGGDEWVVYTLPAGWQDYYPDYSNNQITTDEGACTFLHGEARSCCEELGLPFVGDYLGTKSERDPDGGTAEPPPGEGEGGCAAAGRPALEAASLELGPLLLLALLGGRRRR